jgi:hypothetical protein
MILFDMPMYPDQREKLDHDCREGIARLANELPFQRSEAHQLVAQTQFMTNASVAGANAILAAMAKWEASVAEHRLQAARLVECGGPDDYVEQAMFATMELDQFLYWVRGTRARLMTAQPMPAFQQPMPAFQQPMATGPAPADAGLGADYWNRVAEIQKQGAKDAKELREYTNRLNSQSTADGVEQASRQSAKVRSVL